MRDLDIFSDIKYTIKSNQKLHYSFNEINEYYININLSCFIYIKYIFFIILVLTEAGSFRDILGAVARWCVWFHRPSQEHRSRGSARARHVLRAVDPRPVHAASGERHGLESNVSPQVSRPCRLLGWRVREALHKVRNTPLHLRTPKSLLISCLILLVSLLFLVLCFK